MPMAQTFFCQKYRGYGTPVFPANNFCGLIVMVERAQWTTKAARREKLLGVELAIRSAKLNMMFRGERSQAMVSRHRCLRMISVRLSRRQRHGEASTTNKLSPGETVCVTQTSDTRISDTQTCYRTDAGFLPMFKYRAYGQSNEFRAAGAR
jgi:hypothetical protein